MEKPAHSLDAIGFFARVYHHNLNAPLAGLKMLTEIIGRNPAEVSEDVLTTYLDGSKELYRVIADLSTTLDDFQKMNEPWQHLQIEEELKEVENASPANVKVSYDSFESSDLQFNKALFKIVFTEIFNQVENFSERKGQEEVTISSLESNSYKIINVQDKTNGFDSAKFGENIYKPYKRLSETSDNESKGTSLFRIKTIMQMTGGEFILSSKVGQGCHYKLSFPKS